MPLLYAEGMFAIEHIGLAAVDPKRLAEWLGRVPRVGEAAERDGIRIEIVAANDRRVDRARILRAHQPEPPKEHPAVEEKKDA